MARTKLVNGKPAPLSAEEEAARDAEEKAQKTRPQKEPDQMTIVAHALKIKGVLTDVEIAAAKEDLMK